ncbi:hypothetical protein IC762_28150 [Bradyrhizobium genosp. L]|uniref:hypothetical protein n=1 Tax=Bradyrhizobium genosp. L TaxID=83637 RepID=UPI0018A30AE1|nr:hypothetical protein [Bradyrhizobium genosp. L]QPF83545.1 hypothetical protein IC762_28150 [Bradyrhizobium genosp. L]
MNRDFWSALFSWWPFVALMAAWFLFGRKRVLALVRSRMLSKSAPSRADDRSDG